MYGFDPYIGAKNKYGFDPYIRTIYGPDIPYNPYIVATLLISYKFILQLSSF